MPAHPHKDLPYTICISATIDAEVEQTILDGLNAYNDAITGYQDRQVLRAYPSR